MKLFHGFVGLALLGQEQAEIEVGGRFVGIGGNGAAERVFGFVEIAKLAIDDGGIDERRGDAGTKRGGAFVFGGRFVQFLAIGVEIAEV